jgi:hypothetical protein
MSLRMRAGTLLVIMKPRDRSRPDQDETLDGGVVVPGFTLTVQQLFAELDWQG